MRRKRRLTRGEIKKRNKKIIEVKNEKKEKVNKRRNKEKK